MEPVEQIPKTKWLRCVFFAQLFLSFSFSLLLHFALIFEFQPAAAAAASLSTLKESSGKSQDFTGGYLIKQPVGCRSGYECIILCHGRSLNLVIAMCTYS